MQFGNQDWPDAGRSRARLEARRCQSLAQPALRIEKLVLRGSHRDVSLTFFKLGEVYKAQGNIEAALENFQAALTVERQLDGDEDRSTMARTLTEIGNIFLQRGDTDAMMDVFCEAARLFRDVSCVSVSGLRLYAAGFSSAAAAA